MSDYLVFAVWAILGGLNVFLAARFMSIDTDRTQDEMAWHVLQLIAGAALIIGAFVLLALHLTEVTLIVNAG